MLAASCIITDVPQFEEEERTPPKLLDQEADPTNRQLLFIPRDAQSQTFSAEVVSENDLEQDIQVRLLIDYGVRGVDQNVYRAEISNTNPVSPATTPDEPRVASATWFRGAPQLEGCHTFTLMVSHDFDDRTGCPEDIADSSEITWVAFICTDADCQSQPLDLSGCPREPLERCPDVPDDVDRTSSSTGGP